MPRPGRDGYQPKRIQSRRTSRGRIEDELQAFGQIGANHWQLYLYDQDYRENGPDGPQLISDELGPTVRLVVVRKLMLELTNMTHAELTALREFTNRAFDIAEPVVLARDKEAQDAFDTGDDAVARLHRTVPQIVVREGAQRAHGEVLRLGPEAAAQLGTGELNRLVGPGGSGRGVADGDAGRGGGEDDDATAD